MSDVREATSGRSKGRSPSYPGIPLEKAIDRARQLYAKERLYPTPLMTVMKHWGYTNATGRSGMALAALKKFGLLEDVGKGSADDRRLKLTQLADDILNHPSSDAQREAIRAAALMPGIHRELWEEYRQHLPSDANLEFNLRRNRGFTESGAAEFVQEYRATMEFAGLMGDSDERPAPEDVPAGNEFDDEEMPAETETLAETGSRWAVPPAFTTTPLMMPAAPAVPASAQAPAGTAPTAGQAPVQSYPIPIALQGRPPVIISGAFPLSEAEWTQFKAVLDAMRPVLVVTPSAGAPTEGLRPD